MGYAERSLIESQQASGQRESMESTDKQHIAKFSPDNA